MHLRPSLCFFDICGGLISNYLASDGKKYKYKPSKFVKSYSRVWRTNKDRKIPIKPQIFLPEGISSIQYTYYTKLPLSECENDVYSYRILAINGFNLPKIEKFGNMLYRLLIKHSRKIDGSKS